MNKLEGFYELKKSGLPSVPWEKYDANTVFDEKILWTVRSAVLLGDDLNLPRKVGVNSYEAKEFADQLINNLGENGMVLFYPYFIADKSGVMEVSADRVVIEAVKDDLWNLVTNNKKDVTIIISEEDIFYDGNKDFLSNDEITKLLGYSTSVKRMFRSLIAEGKSIFLEWSFAYISDINKKPTGKKELVFYEIRSV
ncbi:MAG: hypothetical protein N2645_01565 [Clostridia bacterium]|nr:hypothetical protein [Clostridia bacterium]